MLLNAVMKGIIKGNKAVGHKKRKPKGTKTETETETGTGRLRDEWRRPNHCIRTEEEAGHLEFCNGADSCRFGRK